MAGEAGRERTRASLIDRLLDLDPGARSEPRPLRAFTKAQWREAVRRDLEWLLNTRCPVPASELARRGRTVLEYGLPDVVALTPQSTQDHRRVAELIAETIAAYEPRLQGVRVQVARVRRNALDIRIDARLVTDRTPEPVSFAATVAAQGESVAVREA
jgi:type VI secretion system protein ImpF